MSAPTLAHPISIPAIVYKHRCAVLNSLRDAFAFEVSSGLTDVDDNVAYAGMSHADGVIMINTEWIGWTNMLRRSAARWRWISKLRSGFMLRPA
jgi:hypothetical protein